MKKILAWTWMLCSLLLAGCDKLDDSDDGTIREVLPGRWAFSYVIQSDEDPGLEFSYKQVTFNEDGTCAITYVDRMDDEGNPVMAALHGNYVASGAVIRIVSSEIDGEERVMLWRIVSLSLTQLVAEYDFTMDGNSLTVIVTLDKL